MNAIPQIAITSLATFLLYSPRLVIPIILISIFVAYIAIKVHHKRISS